MNSIAFRCERDGLSDVLGTGLLGGYDGAGAWTVVLAALRDADEQQLVETHEGLHHELQASSAWGLIGAMSSLLAARGTRPEQLGEAFDEMVARSTRVHELFATYLSTAPIGLEQGRALLAGNTRYTEFLLDALSLVPVPGTSRQVQETAIAAVLRCAMAPLAVTSVLEQGFAALRRGRIVEPAHTPDERLAAFLGGDGPAGWAHLFAEIRADYPDLGGDLGGEDRRSLPDGAADVERLRRFEEEVLLRRCYEHVVAWLDAGGSPSIAWADQAAVADSLVREVRMLDDGLGDRLAVVTERRPILDDGLDYDRQRIRLRGGADCEQIDGPDVLRRLPALLLGAGDDRYVCGVWLAGSVVLRQFVPQAARASSGITPTDRITALVNRVHRPDGSELTRLGLLDPDTTPGQVQRQIGGIPLVAVTSHASLLDPAVQATLVDDEPIFVVMDLPVAWHVDEWIRQGAQVRMAASPLEGTHAELWIAVFVGDHAPHLRFLSLGGKVGTAMLIERILRRHVDRLSIDNRLLGDGVEYAVRAILTTWRVLEQDSVA
ncbi:hypothetical protein ACFP2T_46780 [Plantactinospora solaniradicis]|uniref:Uncharacterized protein n=1 Tax=Plantactinospora solaniradicis TaxID=1723736 RepID=A0ABW1KSC3_9ACTN